VIRGFALLSVDANTREHSFGALILREGSPDPDWDSTDQTTTSHLLM
jgi:hypothetical protein